MHDRLPQFSLYCHYLYSEVPSSVAIFVNLQSYAQHGQTPFYSMTQAYTGNYLGNLSNYLGNLKIGNHLVYTDPLAKLLEPLHHTMDLKATLLQI